MSIKNLVRVSGAATLCALLGASSAAALTYDFTGGGALGAFLGTSTYVFADTTATESLTAYGLNTETNPAMQLHQNAQGIGVARPGDTVLSGNGSTEVDNGGPDEAIVFDLGASFLATQMVLTWASGIDDYQIYGTNAGSVTSCTSGGLSCVTGGSTLLASGVGAGFGGTPVSVDLTGTGGFRYLIATTPGTAGIAFDGYRVASLSGDLAMAPVPLPAAGGLLAMALAGLVGLRRRKSQA